MEKKNSSANGAVFDLRGVEYVYGGKFPALQSVNLEVRGGERLALVGTNGCGKSTLLHILDGLLFPLRGEVRAFGEAITEERFKEERFAAFFRQKVGFLFQNADAQLFCPTVLDEVAFGPLQLDFPSQEALARSREMLAILGLEKIADRSPHQLSGGEKKKVALAALLAVNPDVLLLDEPTGGLDPRTQVWLVEILGELHGRGKTIITATHDLSILEEIADRAVVMDENHTIAAEGPCRHILENLELLHRVNLIHEHIHRHEDILHSHRHAHFFAHRHRSQDDSE
jgi:cobalt/nickel transport system ATP-binding protein